MRINSTGESQLIGRGLKGRAANETVRITVEKYVSRPDQQCVETVLLSGCRYPFIRCDD